MFRHLLILLLSTVLATFAWSKYEFPEDRWPQRFIGKPGPSNWESANKGSYYRASKYGNYGGMDTPYDHYSEEDDDDDDDNDDDNGDAFIDDCNGAKQSSGWRGSSGPSMLRGAKLSLLRSNERAPKDPRKMPRPMWIPVKMPAPYPTDDKYLWGVKKGVGNNEDFVRPARDSFAFSEPMDQGFAKPAEMDSSFETKRRPWTDPLDLNGPSAEKAYNENVNFNSNTNFRRRFNSPKMNYPGLNSRRYNRKHLNPRYN